MRVFCVALRALMQKLVFVEHITADGSKESVAATRRQIRFDYTTLEEIRESNHSNERKCSGSAFC